MQLPKDSKTKPDLEFNHEGHVFVTDCLLDWQGG